MTSIDLHSLRVKPLKGKESLGAILRKLFEGGNYNHSQCLLDHGDGYALTEYMSSRILVSNMFIVAFPYGFNPENNQRIFSELKEKKIIRNDYNLYQMETCYRHPKRENNATLIMIYPNHLDPIEILSLRPPVWFEYNTAQKRAGGFLPDKEVKFYEQSIKDESP